MTIPGFGGGDSTKPGRNHPDTMTPGLVNIQRTILENHNFLRTVNQVFHTISMANCKQIAFFFVSHDDWVNVPQSSYFPRMIPLGFFGWAEQTADMLKFETPKRFGNHRTSRILMVKSWCPPFWGFSHLLFDESSINSLGSLKHIHLFCCVWLFWCFNQLNLHLTPAATCSSLNFRYLSAQGD